MDTSKLKTEYCICDHQATLATINTKSNLQEMDSFI